MRLFLFLCFQLVLVCFSTVFGQNFKARKAELEKEYKLLYSTYSGYSKSLDSANILIKRQQLELKNEITALQKKELSIIEIRNQFQLPYTVLKSSGNLPNQFSPGVLDTIPLNCMNFVAIKYKRAVGKKFNHSYQEYPISKKRKKRDIIEVLVDRNERLERAIAAISSILNDQRKFFTKLKEASDGVSDWRKLLNQREAMLSAQLVELEKLNGMNNLSNKPDSPEPLPEILLYKPIVRPLPDTVTSTTEGFEIAEFDGDLKKYLVDNMTYPTTAVDLGLEGKCYLQMRIDENGIVTDVEVKRGVPDCPECDKEAVRVMRNSPPWFPALYYGEPVVTHYQLPIIYKLW